MTQSKGFLVFCAMVGAVAPDILILYSKRWTMPQVTFSIPQYLFASILYLALAGIVSLIFPYKTVSHYFTLVIHQDSTFNFETRVGCFWRKYAGNWVYSNTETIFLNFPHYTDPMEALDPYLWRQKVQVKVLGNKTIRMDDQILTMTDATKGLALGHRQFSYKDGKRGSK